MLAKFLVKISDFFLTARRGAVWAVILVAAASIFGVSQYRYGWEDQTITVPYLKAALNPALYPHDYVLAQRPYYYTSLWFALAGIIRVTSISLPALFFLAYAAAAAASFYILYLLAMEFFGKRESAVVALVLILFANVTMAGAAVMDDMLITKLAALPFVLLAMLLFLREKYYSSYAILGVAFLLHPLTALYGLGMIAVASLAHFRRLGVRRFGLALLIFVLAALPILVWKALYSPSSLHFLAVDPRWLELLRLRSGHHIFPLAWGANLYVKAVLIIGAFLAGLKYIPAGRHRTTLRAFALAVALMALVGVVGTEVYPISIVLVLQLMRSFQFFTYFAAILFANYIIREFENLKHPGEAAVLALGVVGFFYDTRDWQVSYFSLAAFIAFGWLIYFLAGARGRKFWQDFSTTRIFSTLAVGLAVGFGGLALVAQHGFSIQNAQAKPWLDVQAWARVNTNKADVFIVPPSVDGFRVESERTIYGDWKDGTLMNFNPDFGFEWLRRMNRLGYRADVPLETSYQNLTGAEFVSIAREAVLGQARVYAVTFKNAPNLPFPLKYDNGQYLVYEVVSTH